MSAKQIIVQREVSERPINVERESTLIVNATGIFPAGTKDITENGVYDVTMFKNAFVHVPEPEGTINITENGTYDVKEYASAEVGVPTVSDAFTTDPVAQPIDALLYLEANISSTATNINVRNLRGVKTVKLYGGGAVANIFQLLQGSYAVETLDLSELSLSESGVSASQFAYNQTALKSVSFKDGAKMVAWENAFDGCTGLEEIDLSNVDVSLATTFAYMFQSCRSLKYINLSGWINADTHYTTRMFSGCTSLEALVIDGESVFNLSAGSGLSTSGIGRGTGYVYVPDALVDSYKAASYWSTYANQIRPLSELPDEYRS